MRSCADVDEAGDKELALGDTMRDPAITRGPSKTTESELDDGGEGVNKGVSESRSRLFKWLGGRGKFPRDANAKRASL